MSVLDHRKAIILILFAVMIIFGETTAYADTFLPPVPFEIWSEDGTKVFKWDPRLEIHSSYATAQAGVYQNGDLVYSVENLPVVGVSARNFLFSKDLRYLVYKTAADQDVALRFFENGILLQYYRIDELVQDLKVVSYSSSTASWENTIDLDTANNTLTVVTCDDITYVFDITTGEIIRDTAIRSQDESSPLTQKIPMWRSPHIWVFSMALGMIALPLILRLRANKRR